MTNVDQQSLHEMADSGADFGNFYPTHHVFIALPDADTAEHVVDGLREAGFADPRHFSAQQVAEATQHGIDSAGLLAATGASLTMVNQYRKFAEQGCHFVLVKAPSEEETEKVMQIVRNGPFETAQKYRRLVIETLH